MKSETPAFPSAVGAAPAAVCPPWRVRWIVAALAMFLVGCSRSTPPEPPRVAVEGLDRALAVLLQNQRSNVVAQPASGRAWGALGQAFDAADFSAEARTCYVRAAAFEPLEPRWPHLLGLRLLQDDFDAAVVQLNRAVELVGTNSDAPRLRLAQALVERGRLAEATLPLQALLDLQPDHPAARLEMARLRLGRGELEGLPAWLGPCLTNLHTARAAGLLLSQVRARQGQTELATELARRASALPKPYDWPDPFLREVQALRGDRQFLAEKVQSLAAQRRYEEAETALKELLSRAPEDPESLLLAGRLLLEQRKCPEAEARLREHLRVAPDSLNGLTQLGLALLCQQRWTDAVAVLEQALQRKPDFAQAHANLGLARSRTGDGAGAIRAYEEALRCSPGDPGYHVALAEELLRAGRSAEAVSHLERALALDPRNARARALRERMGAR